MGIENFLFKRWRSYVDWRFDRHNSVDTSGTFTASDVSDDANYYAGTPPYRFRSMLSDLGFDPNETTFVDFGCGKGRVLLMACQFGFKRVIGLELSQELSRIAKKNVDSYQRAQRGSCDIQVICENAADFYIPPGKTLLYFYNPFMENVMRAVLSNIQRGLGEAFRDITIIYYNPLYGHLFNSADFLDCVKKGRASTRFIKVLRSRDVLTQLGQPTDPKISPLQARKPPL